MTAITRKRIDSKHIEAGTYIFKVKKNGEKSAKPMWVKCVGLETCAEDILDRVQRLNPNNRYSL